MRAELDRPAHDLGETRVRLQLLDVGAVAQRHRRVLDQLDHRALVDRVLAERRQHVRDVVHEDGVRAHDEHTAERLPVRVEEVRRPMEPDRGLPGAGPALDDERRLGLARDEAVLVGLDGRDDVAHARVTRSLELLQQEVVERARRVGERPVERLVADAGERSALEPEPAPERDAVRLGRRRGVEGTRGGRLPVDDHHAVVVVDPAAADVEGVVHGVDVDAAEAQDLLGLLVRGEPAVDPGLDPPGGDVGALGADPRGADRAEQRLPHALEADVRVVEVGLLGGDVRMRHRAGSYVGRFQPTKIAHPRSSRPYRR